MNQNLEALEEEATRATALLRNRVVQYVWRHRDGELVIQFTDGTSLFANALNGGLELSITGTPE